MPGFMDPQRRRTFIAYFLFGAIILVFIFWGYKQSDMPGTSGYAAVVNNTVITIGDFRRALERQLQFYSRMFGKQLDAAAMKSMNIRGSTLDKLINQELIVQGAQAQGIWASDAEVRQLIFDIPAFQKDGRFQRDFYQNYLSGNGMSPSQFESDLRKDLVLQDIREIFEVATKPTKDEVAKEIQARSLKVNLDYAAYDPSSSEQRIKVSDAEAEKFLKSEGSDSKVKEFYNAHTSDYVKLGEVHARHILIKSAGDKASDEAALKKITAIKERLKKEPFEKVAKEVSEDDGSKVKGGDLGFFGKGKMVPPFEEAAFSLEPHKISEPVKSSFGYHLIEVLEKKGGTTTTVEQAKNEIAKKIIAKEKASQTLTEIEKALALPDGAEKNSKVSSLVDQAGLKWEATGPFDAGSQFVPKIGAVEGLAQKAFSLSKEKPYASTLFRQGEKAYVVRLKDFSQEKSEMKEEDAADQISRNRAQDVLKSWQETLSSHAKIERNLELVTRE